MRKTATPTKSKRGRKKNPLNDSLDTIRNEVAKRYQLHAGQLVPYRKVFHDGKKRIFLQCGRNWGKTNFIAFAAVEFALTNPGSHCYIIFPEKTQGYEILWASGLLRKIFPPQYVATTRTTEKAYVKSEMRITTIFDSFVKIIGADDPDSLRGIKPHFCAYDEYRDFKEGVYWNMEANLIAKDATLVIGSTPPDLVGHYSELRMHFIEESQKKDSSYFYLELPSHTNPLLDREKLEAVKRRLVSHGQLRVWEREYEAKFIPGGASSILPMYADNRSEIFVPMYIMAELMRPMASVLEWYCIFDPASSSVFGVLFIAYNRLTAQVFVVDEMYEQDRRNTSSIDMWNAALEKKKLYMKKRVKWENVYDEHESWFHRDLERYLVLEDEESIQPTQKASRNKEEDLSIVKDVMLCKHKLFIADHCRHFDDELSSYATDSKGKFVKRKDHLIDCFRYFLAASHYTLNEEPDYAQYLKVAMQKRTPLSGFNEYIENRRMQEDWTTGIDEVNLIAKDDVIYIEDFSDDNFL